MTLIIFADQTERDLKSHVTYFRPSYKKIIYVPIQKDRPVRRKKLRAKNVNVSSFVLVTRLVNERI